MTSIKAISDFPALLELIEFFKKDNERVEARVQWLSSSYTYIIHQGCARIYGINNELIQSIII